MKKYVVLLGVIAVLSMAAILCGSISSDTSSYYVSASLTQFKVVYVKDGVAVLTELVEKDKTTSPPDEEEIPDGKFITWCVNGNAYDFSAPVTGETVLTAVYNKRFNVTFIADGQTVKISEYTYFNRNSVEKPEVPEKLGYIGYWESCTLDGGDKTVNAVYEPINYEIIFMLDGTNAQEVTCSIEDYKDKIPEIPFKNGYEGAWEYARRNDGKIIATVNYIPIQYEIIFYVDGEEIKTEHVTVEDKDLCLPSIPHKEHYTAEWEEIELNSATVAVNAVYTPVVYKAEFLAFDGVIKSVEYTVLDKVIEQPAVPERPHYSGKWESYELPYKDFVVRAEYVPTEYEIAFVADGKEVGKAAYTVETDLNSVNIPPVPQKAGFVGEWEPFKLCGGDLTVCAIYKPVEGTAGLVYKKSGEGYIVTGFKGTAAEVTVPSFYEGLPVTEIGANAFMQCTVEKVTICENIQVLREGAFLRCENLGMIKLPESLESIGDNAFYICSSLTELIIPDGVKDIGTYAFGGCSSLEKVYVGAGVQRIGECAFLMCGKLKEAQFAVSVGWVTAPANYGSLISVSPQSAATVLTERCDYEFTRPDKEDV